MKKLQADAESGNIVSIRIWSSISSRNIFENNIESNIPPS